MKKKNYFKVFARIIFEGNTIYISDGYISVASEKIEGYLTDDYITGICQDEKTSIEIIFWDNEFNTNAILKKCSFISKERFNKSSINILYSEENPSCKFQLQVQREIKDSDLIEKINQGIEKVKFSHFPN